MPKLLNRSAFSRKKLRRSGKKILKRVRLVTCRSTSACAKSGFTVRSKFSAVPQGNLGVETRVCLSAQALAVLFIGGALPHHVRNEGHVGPRRRRRFGPEQAAHVTQVVHVEVERHAVPSTHLVAAHVHPRKIDGPLAAVGFVAEGFEGDCHLGRPIAVVLFGGGVPAVVPGKIGVVGLGAQQALALRTKSVEHKKETVRFFVQRVKNESNAVVVVIAHVAAQAGDKPLAFIISYKADVEVLLVVEHPHHGLMRGQGVVHRELFPKATGSIGGGPGRVGKVAVNFNGKRRAFNRKIAGGQRD